MTNRRWLIVGSRRLLNLREHARISPDQRFLHPMVIEGSKGNIARLPCRPHLIGLTQIDKDLVAKLLGGQCAIGFCCAIIGGVGVCAGGALIGAGTLAAACVKKNSPSRRSYSSL